MKRRSVARAVGLCLAGTGLFLVASAANAAPAPEGSYQQSCRNFAASHGTLSAECKSSAGAWSATQLGEYRSCTGDISNNNGQLTCQKGSGAAGPSGPGPARTSGQGSGATGGQGSGGTGGQGPAATGGQGSGATDGQGSGGHGGTGGQGPSGTTGQGPAGTGGQGPAGTAGTSGQGPAATGGTGGQGSGGTGHGDDHTGDRNHSDNGNDSDRGAPAGSYKDTCRNVHMDGDNLVAECRTRDGDWHRTSLDNYRQCRGDISNDDGRLRCQRGDEGRGGRGDEGQGGGLEPRGSYQQTCRNVRVDHGDLTAECRTRDGDWNRTSLDNFGRCDGDIANDNGRLLCQRGDEGRGGRGDEYRGRGGYEPRQAFARITLYENSRFRGRSRSFDSDTPDLGGFADKASSANIQGGVWQLCTRRFYRGRCVTLDRNVNNFVSLGINDRTESLRRVR